MKDGLFRPSGLIRPEKGGGLAWWSMWCNWLWLWLWLWPFTIEWCRWLRWRRGFGWLPGRGLRLSRRLSFLQRFSWTKDFQSVVMHYLGGFFIMDVRDFVGESVIWGRHNFKWSCPVWFKLVSDVDWVMKPYYITNVVRGESHHFDHSCPSADFEHVLIVVGHERRLSSGGSQDWWHTLAGRGMTEEVLDKWYWLVVELLFHEEWSKVLVPYLSEHLCCKRVGLEIHGHPNHLLCQQDIWRVALW